MNAIDTTVLILARDRFSGVDVCLRALAENTPNAIHVIVADMGYSESEQAQMRREAGNFEKFDIVPVGFVTPMQAVAAVREQINTTYTVLLDNDSQPTANWLDPLIECAQETQAAIVSPLVLEREGFGNAADRNHLTTSDILCVYHDNVPYLIEHKHELRLLPNDLKGERADTSTFELHGVLFETAALKMIDIPDMVVREHIDIALQLRTQGRRVVHEPGSTILFDNLGTRMNGSDVKFFNFRWSDELIKKSSDLFAERWGYRFYSENFMHNWAKRRRLYLGLRRLYLPEGLCDIVVRAYNKFVLNHWDPIPNAENEGTELALEGLARRA